ncbi:hypothetical protein BDV25DRAFT_172111 [Aspergillus avenaceus]|uniref:Carrier domain-containing protein n=1 Tax=Aspergillus avenaceus TaxID=36643 RepID=A0A5N6U8P1_ASPAV|nr:hypothetical protein BDV25DRAFT_172111 [Aspergillus avenaceus]
MEPPDGPGLAGLLSQQFERFAYTVAIKAGEEELTYAQVHAKALSLAQHIRHRQLPVEEPIGILSPRGINHIISQIAVIYAGGTCVPLDVNHPDQYLVQLLKNVNITFLLTDKDNSRRLADQNFHHFAVDYRCLPVLTCQSLGDEATDLPPSQYRSHIFHTSGSTGHPKAVQVLASGIINYCINKTFVPIHQGQRFGHLSNVTFDVSIMETIGSFLRGATVVILDRETVLDPTRLARCIRDSRIDVLWQTPALLAATITACPQAYATIDTLLTGGEVVTVHLARRVFECGPPKRIWNLYGPTECTMFSTWHNITIEDVVKGKIPIGRPMNNYEVLIVDESLYRTSDGEVGEILIGGKGVTAGYLGESGKSNTAFISYPIDALSCRVYRTGDLGRWNRAGVLEFVGRRDNQVKICGHRIELEAVESVLMATGLVTAATAVKIDINASQAESILLACVVPISSEIDPAMITQAYIGNAPQLMVPSLEVVDVLPLTETHKVDRGRLVEQYAQEIEHRLHTSSRPLTPIHQTVQDAFGLELEPDDNFFARGVSSLHAARLVSRIREEFGVQLQVGMIYKHSTIKGLTRLIESLQQGTKWPEKGENPWKDDLNLGKDLRPISGNIPDWTSNDEGRVFLTGVTGFIGIHLLAELLPQPHVQRVACIVRATDELTALQRIIEACDRYHVRPRRLNKLWAIPGDFSEESLGLSQADFNFFSKWASVVFHLGAHVNWIQPYEPHRPANVLGLLNMIRFANTERPKAFHYVSSTSVYGPTGSVTGAMHVGEDETPVTHIDALEFDTGYSQSKSIAEAIAWNAISKGLAITIHRPGFVLGPSETGIGNPDDFLGRIVPSCIRAGCYPHLPDHRDAYVMVDFVVSCLLHIASCKNTHGRAYNLVEPHDGMVSLSDIFECISERCSRERMKAVPYADWLKQCQVQSADDPHHPLIPLLPLLEEVVLENKTRWELQAKMPTLGTENLRNALSTSPDLLRFPTIRSLLPIYARGWIGQG